MLQTQSKTCFATFVCLAGLMLPGTLVAAQDTVIESADLAWSNTLTHDAGGSEGLVNGFWGSEVNDVSSTVSVPAGATSAVLKLRYWAIDAGAPARAPGSPHAKPEIHRVDPESGPTLRLL